MKVVAYTRLSPMDGPGRSVDVQREQIEAWCKFKQAELLEVYTDKFVSGKNLERPSLIAMLERIKDEDVDAVVITKIDRVSRYLPDVLQLVERLKKMKVQFVSLAETIDTSTAAGMFAMSIFGAAAQLERDRLIERTCEALAYRKAHGVRLGRAPLGETLVGSGEKGARERVGVPEETELSGLDRAEELQGRGCSIRAICDILDAEFPRKNGARWSKSAVHRALKRRKP